MRLAKRDRDFGSENFVSVLTASFGDGRAGSKTEDGYAENGHAPECAHACESSTARDTARGGEAAQGTSAELVAQAELTAEIGNSACAAVVSQAVGPLFE